MYVYLGEKITVRNSCCIIISAELVLHLIYRSKKAPSLQKKKFGFFTHVREDMKTFLQRWVVFRNTI
jgi:hypothetical protein